MNTLTFIKSDFANLEGKICDFNKEIKNSSDAELTEQYVNVFDCPVVRAAKRSWGEMGDPEHCPIYYKIKELNKVLNLLKSNDTVTVSWDDDEKVTSIVSP